MAGAKRGRMAASVAGMASLRGAGIGRSGCARHA
jgi:hypothetical protein